MPPPRSVDVLEHPRARVAVRELGEGRREVRVEPSAPMGSDAAGLSCTTSYPVDLIASILDVKGPHYLCDEIRRDEDPQYVELYLRWATLSFVAAEDFRGKRMLDFGSGAGASTLVLARLFPSAEIVGVELLPEQVQLARRRAEFHRATNARFLESAGPAQLPADLGSFDFIMFSAVYEHLLPAERSELFPRVWALLRPGGILFLNQTPYRWYPLEYHTTGLPLLNYLPDGVAGSVARALSPRVPRDATWENLLRDGIRGATVGEILDVVESAGYDRPRVVRPSRMGCEDAIDIWYGYSMARRPLAAKRIMRSAFKGLSRLTRRLVVPELNLALERPAR